MSQEQQRRPAKNAAASPITCPDDTDEVGYPRCDVCGARAPSEEFLERHRIRRCPGPLGARPLLRRARRWRTR